MPCEFRRMSRNGMAVVTAVSIWMSCVFAPRLYSAESVNAAAESEARILSHIKYLAGDELGGRGIGTTGIQEAATYLAEAFQEMGLTTDLYESGPFQEFTVKTGVTMGSPNDNRLEFVRRIEGGASDDSEAEPDPVNLTLEEDFVTLAIGSSGEFNGELVFVGYGISSEKNGYDDYAELSVKDRVVIMLRKEPRQDDPKSVFDGTRSSVHAQFRRKIQNAVKQGAAAVILVNDNKTPEEKRKDLRKGARRQWSRIAKSLRTLRSQMMPNEDGDQRTGQGESSAADDPASTAEPKESDPDGQRSVEEFAESLESIEKQVEELRETYREIDDPSYDPLVGFLGAGARSAGPIPVFFASRMRIDKLLESALNTDLLTIEQSIDSDMTPRSVVLEGWTAQGTAKVIQDRTAARNVVAVIEGEGPLANETVVIGAHYDHLGRGGPGTLAPWTVAIHNGADDNASGTSALLEVARAFASRDEKPRRRIVFIGFTGEESGLLGSAQYVKHPRFPLEDTVAMVNLDMVGRLKDNGLTVQGTGTAKEFDSLVDRLNEKHGFDIDKVKTGYGPSDHASFYGRDVPVLFLFTGLHKDYHRPGDDWDKINVQGVRRVVDFTIDIVDELLQAEAAPSYIEIRRRGRFAADRNRVILGIMPELAASEEGGLTIRRTTDDGPAEAAGLMSGDIIQKVNDSQIGSLNDLRGVLSKHKADDIISVTVNRDGEQKTVQVTLKAAG